MTIVKSFGMPETEETRRLLQQISRLGRITGKSFSELNCEALHEFVEHHTRLFQEKLDTFKDPLFEKLDKLHQTFLSPNPKGYGSWEECLTDEGLLCDQAIAYSLDKGWKISTGATGEKSVFTPKGAIN